MVLVLGAGKMGRAIAYDLMKNGVETNICDMHDVDIPNFFKLDVHDKKNLLKSMRKEDLVISSLPYDLNYMLAQYAIKTKTSFVDLGGNSNIVEKELAFHKDAKTAGVSLIPDCGLAPGMINIIAYHLWQEGARDIHVRVGGLPQEPKAPLNYALFFSIHGLINEYLENSFIIKNKILCEEESLTGLEDIYFNGFPKLEAFYTHGGISTLPLTLENVRELDYKTIRYQGHAEKIMLLKQLGFFAVNRRKYTEMVLEQTLEKNVKDVILARVSSNEKIIEMIDYYDEKEGFSAMARTTGFPTAVIAKMILDGNIPPGAYPPEIVVDYNVFIKEIKRRGISWRKL